MEQLKSILADKILDLSTEQGVDVKAQLDKMHRFRDFANACQALMDKYPQIETELISMVEVGDFDTKKASARVDAVIRLADGKQAPKVEVQTELVPTVDSYAKDENENETIIIPEIIAITETANADNDNNAKQKATIKKVLQVLGLVLAVIILIYLIKFVIANWIVTLSIVGGLALIAIIVWFVQNKKSN